MRKLILPVLVVLAVSLLCQTAPASEPTFEWYAVSRTEAETAEAIRRWSFGPAGRAPVRRAVGALRPFRGVSVRRERRMERRAARPAQLFGC